jgi:uncharacterized protein HemX
LLSFIGCANRKPFADTSVVGSIVSVPEQSKLVKFIAEYSAGVLIGTGLAVLALSVATFYFYRQNVKITQENNTLKNQLNQGLLVPESYLTNMTAEFDTLISTINDDLNRRTADLEHRSLVSENKIDSPLPALALSKFSE